MANTNQAAHDLADDLSDNFENTIPFHSLIDKGRFEAAFDKQGVDLSDFDTDVDYEVGRVAYQSFGVIVEFVVDD